MEAVGSTRLGRASSRYGGPAVFSGPVRKWQKKWVHVPPPTASSSLNNNNSHSHNINNNNNNNASSRILLRRWTPVTATAADGPHDSSATASDEPPRRKFRYTPIVVLEEQKKAVVEKAEYEPTTETDQLKAAQTSMTHEMHGKLNMNEISEEAKVSNIGELDLGLGLQGNNGDNCQSSDDQLLEKFSVGAP